MQPNLTPIRSILLTTDLSTDASSAYGMAASLSQVYGCALTLLSCIDTSPQYSEANFGTMEAPAMAAPQALADAYSDVEKALQQCLSENFDRARTAYHIIQAPVAVKHSIINYVAEMQPDLLIMSSHGRSGIARALLGSVTEHVIRHCKRPVLVVPANPR